MIVLGVYQMPGSNALALQEAVQARMAELERRFPKGIAWNIRYDTTRFVSASMRDVLVTLVEALILVVLVVFVFLQSWRATVIPVIAIPVSLVAIMIVMVMLGFSLNMLSLLGIVLAVGLVVDDAIVVVENVERQLAAGLPPLEATRRAMREVTGPIIATTAVLMAVFIPVAFIPGVAGRLYNQFALTVAISVGLSAFNSLTLSPALSAAFLRPGHGPTRFAPFRLFNTGFERMSAAYARSVAWLIRLRWLVVAAFAACLAATWLVAQRVPSTFLPVEDQGYFFVVVQLPDGASLERTDAVTKRVRDTLHAMPGIDITGSISGLNFLTNAAQSSSAIVFAILDSWEERGRSPRPDRGRGPAGPAPDPRGDRAQLRPALDPGPGHHRRLRVPGPGPGRPRQRRPGRGRPGRDRGGAQAARDRRRAAVHRVQHLDAAVRLRPRPQQGEAAGPEPALTCSTRSRSTWARST
jgi:HAE1 family hydrophobic/amphiphilic exporter-1